MTNGAESIRQAVLAGHRIDPLEPEHVGGERERLEHPSEGTVAHVEPARDAVAQARATVLVQYATEISVWAFLLSDVVVGSAAS